MLNFLSQNNNAVLAFSAAVQAVSTVILVLVTIYYAVQTKKTVKEMQETRRYEFLPIVEIKIIAENYTTIKLTLSNIGKGIARSPNVYIPLIEKPFEIQNLGPKGVNELKIEAVKTDEILALTTNERKIIVKYLDVFSRKITSEATILPETVEPSHSRKNHLTIDNWDVILPNN